jgi:RHS repeat-associated protein
MEMITGTFDGGQARFHGATLDYRLSRLALNSDWTALGGQQLKLQEESSADSELSHTTETLDILQIEDHLFAQDVTTHGGDTISIRRRGPTPRSTLSGYPVERDLVYLHTDHLGTVVKATDEERTIVWDAVRDPFGRRHVKVELVEMPLGFSGQYYDQESGNFYNYFRDYDPTTGRYLQSDPIGLRGGLNTYVYVKSNPLSWVDVYGLEGFLTIHASSGFVLGSVHSWLEYNKTGGSGPQTWGTFGNDPYGKGNGLHSNLELGQTGDVTRTLYISDRQEFNLLEIINNIQGEGENAWEIDRNCSFFSSDVWNQVTHEDLNPLNNWNIPTPAALKEKIFIRNGYRSHYRQNTNNSNGDSLLDSW